MSISLMIFNDYDFAILAGPSRECRVQFASFDKVLDDIFGGLRLLKTTDYISAKTNKIDLFCIIYIYSIAE